MPFTSVPGGSLYWKVDGAEDAPPLILLNSIGTEMDLWDPVLPALRERFRLPASMRADMARPKLRPAMSLWPDLPPTYCPLPTRRGSSGSASPGCRSAG